MGDHWVPFYVGDYEKDTKHLSLTEDGAYFRLLRYVWGTGRRIPGVESAYRIAGAQSDQDRACVDRILIEFFEEKNDEFFNKKAEKILKKQNEKRRKLSEHGRRGGLAKATKMLEQKASIPDPDLEVISSEITPPTPKGERGSFEIFWSQYPKKVAKAAVKRHWDRKKLDNKASDILAAVKRYKATEKWQAEGGRYVPNPLTFLNQERWDDEIPQGVAETTSLKSDHKERILSAWRAGQPLRYVPQGAIAAAEALIPTSAAGKRDDRNPDHFRAKSCPDEPLYFRDFEIVDEGESR
jgi:uncharacterized protein YdaU (DUF1376 family)